jgi:DNA-binding CsgD family transcriptional regulator
MIASIDLQNFLALMPILYTPRSIEEFPEHVLSLLGKLIDLDESADSCANVQERQVNRPATISRPQHRAVPQFDRNRDITPPRSCEEAAVCPQLQDGSTSKLSQPPEDRWLSQLKNEFPIFTHYFHADEGCATKISDFSIESNFHRVEGVYWRFLKPVTLEDREGKIFTDPLHPTTTHAIYLLKADAICLTISRSHSAFSERDRDLLDLIRPHLVQAYHNAIKFSEIQQQLTQRDLVLNQFGTILLSADGHIQLMTKRAWQLLAQYFAPSSPNYLPENLQQWFEDRRSRLGDRIQQLHPMPPFYLEKSGQHLTVDLVPCSEEEHYLLKIQAHQSPFAIESLQTLGLTKREAEVLCSISKDKGNAEIAKLLNCSLGTVKKHLEHIYEKLQVQTRTAAVMKALQQQVGMIGS